MSEDQVAHVLAALDRLEAGQTQLGAHLDRLEAGQTQLGAHLDRLEAGQVQLRVDIMARIDRVQDTLTAVRDDITVVMGRADQAHRVADNVRDELRALNEVVTGVIRQVRNLQSDVRELRGEP